MDSEETTRKESYLPRSYGSNSKRRAADGRSEEADHPQNSKSQYDRDETQVQKQQSDRPSEQEASDPTASEESWRATRVESEHGADDSTLPEAPCELPEPLVDEDPADFPARQIAYDAIVKDNGPQKAVESDSASDTAPVQLKVNVTGIRFGCAAKIYHFDAGLMDLKARDRVIVRTEKGMGLGEVAIAPFEKEFDAEQLEGLRKVIRKAGKIDFDQEARGHEREAEAYRFCLERVMDLQLPMKLVAAKCHFDGTKYVFYFTAEGRVDFRELVKQLVARFPVRIEMRQIGVRHEAKMTGGLGCCGQELCCSRFLTDFRPVSVRMAKDQNLSLNPAKISGACGRLMCCLGYEHDIYEQFRKGLPKVGKSVNTRHGEAVVLKHNPLAETISVRTDDETSLEITKDDIIPKAPQPRKSKGNAGNQSGSKPRRRSGKKPKEKKTSQ